MASLAELLESFRNYRGVEDWKLKKLQDMLGNEDPENIALNEKLMGIGTSDMPNASGLVGMVSKEGLEDVLKNIERSGVTVDAYANPQSNSVTLSRLLVPKENRNTGLGSEAMQKLIDYADQENALMQLSPSTDFGATSVNRLKDFYKRFGFVPNAGKYKDYAISESMYRPKK